jgi:hypothetical protein
MIKKYNTKKEYIAAVAKYVPDQDYINYLKASNKDVVVESYQELVHSKVITEYAN